MATADNYGLFWDSDNGDRTYNAASFETWLKKFYTTGVFANDFAVTAAGGMSIGVSGGYCNLDGKIKMFDAQSFTLAPAGGQYPRIDAVVIERNNTDRNITMKVVQGAYSGNTPVAPTPVRNNSLYQIIVAQVRVDKGATAITTGNIVDRRWDAMVCGYVTGTVTQLDFDTLLNQYTAWQNEQQEEFNGWFDEMKDQLSTDAAGHLQQEIDDIESQLAYFKTQTVTKNNVTYENPLTYTHKSYENEMLENTSAVIIEHNFVFYSDVNTTARFYISDYYTEREYEPSEQKQTLNNTMIDYVVKYTRIHYFKYHDEDDSVRIKVYADTSGVNCKYFGQILRFF